VVNVDDDVALPADIRERKLNSKRFLFVGQPFYLPGALELIAAARNLWQQGFACEVDIIGIDPGLIAVEYGWLTVHGYLDKDKLGDKQKYYELLSSARLFVNTTPGWSGFQALLEAMYFHNPIVVRPNESLNSYFSNLTTVAHIVEEGGPNLEAILTESLTGSARYKKMSDEARKVAESSTWNNFTTELIGLLK
jgi:glycosyltransferase involved in cell wall biosynthesis